jgi:hypothetical protein
VLFSEFLCIAPLHIDMARPHAKKAPRRKPVVNHAVKHINMILPYAERLVRNDSGVILGTANMKRLKQCVKQVKGTAIKSLKDGTVRQRFHHLRTAMRVAIQQGLRNLLPEHVQYPKDNSVLDAETHVYSYQQVYQFADSPQYKYYADRTGFPSLSSFCEALYLLSSHFNYKQFLAEQGKDADQSLVSFYGSRVPECASMIYETFLKGHEKLYPSRNLLSFSHYFKRPCMQDRCISTFFDEHEGKFLQLASDIKACHAKFETYLDQLVAKVNAARLAIPKNAVDALTGEPILETDVLLDFGDMRKHSLFMKVTSYVTDPRFCMPTDVAYTMSFKPANPTPGNVFAEDWPRKEQFKFDFKDETKRFLHPFSLERVSAKDIVTYLPRISADFTLRDSLQAQSMIRIPSMQLTKEIRENAQDILFRKVAEIFHDLYCSRGIDGRLIAMPEDPVFVDFPTDSDLTVMDPTFKTELDHGRLYLLRQLEDMKFVHPFTRQPVNQSKVRIYRIHGLHKMYEAVRVLMENGVEHAGTMTSIVKQMWTIFSAPSWGSL